MVSSMYYLDFMLEVDMKIIIISLLFLSGIAKATSSQVYVRCFDGNYRTSVDGVIEIYDQVSGGSKYNSLAKLEIQDSNLYKSTYWISGFVRHGQNFDFKTFRFFGDFTYQYQRTNGFRILLGEPSTFGAEISYGAAPYFGAYPVKLGCNFNFKPFPKIRNGIH